MAALRGLIAMSLDGFAADEAGGVGWLEPFHDVDYGYADFIARIGPVVMGRATHDQLATFGPEWPYPGHEGVVVTSRPLPPRPEARAWGGSLTDLAAHLRAGDRDAWIMGGPRLQSAFLEMGALDRLELAVVPVLLGRGLRLFPDAPAMPRQPRLTAVRTFDKGLVLLDYAFG